MASTYSERKIVLDEIATRIRDNDRRIKDARNQIAAAEADLTAMQTAYTTFVQDINSDATANPSDQAFQLQKIVKDKMVSEFQALKAKATSLKTAYDGAV